MDPLLTRSPAEQQLRDRTLGTVHGIDAGNPMRCIANLVETFAYRTGNLNNAEQWHAECIRAGYEPHVVREAAFQLAHAMLAAQRAHDRLVTKLTHSH